MSDLTEFGVYAAEKLGTAVMVDPRTGLAVPLVVQVDPAFVEYNQPANEARYQGPRNVD